MPVPNEDNIVNVEKIRQYVEIIAKKPRIGVSYFLLLEDKTFILNGMKLTMLPLEYSHLSKLEEFVVFVNPNTKKVLYYAYDIEDIVDHTRCNEVEGEMAWDRVEPNIYNFLVKNVKELTTDQFPHYQTVRGTDTTTKYHSASDDDDVNNDYYGWMNSRANNTPDWNAAYKEREAFYDKIAALMKSGKVSSAVDFVADEVLRMCKDGKFESLDTILRLIDFGKITIPVMFSILEAAKDHKGQLKEYNEYIGRIKTHLSKFQPKKVETLMLELDAA
jgi:hypothetical protein